MKIVYILIISFFSIFSATNAFFGSSTSLDLYKNIDNGITDLDQKIYGIEFQGGVNNIKASKAINELAELNNTKKCLNESLEIPYNDFIKVVKNGDISILAKYIDQKCKSNNGKNSISTSLLQTYLGYFKEYEQTIKDTSDKKSEQMQKISSIGIYRDGVLENSSFDLIDDIEQIDKIIFASFEEYEGELAESLSQDSITYYTDDVKKGLTNIKDYLLGSTSDNSSNVDENTNNGNSIEPLSINSNTSNLYICSEDIQSNGLSESSINFLLGNIGDNINESGDQINDSGDSGGDNTGEADNTVINDENSGNYKKITDNSVWPCDTFFCIVVDFVTYEHSLLGGSENITIEYLLNRSNKHLGKFASTSLIQAKMTTNNFELGLKDLNLPDLFHIGFQISKKPVPILNIEAENKKDTGEYSGKSILKTFYEVNGLNYKRRNDLAILRSTDVNKQVILNSNNLHNKNATDNWNSYKVILDENKGKIDFINKAVEKEISSSGLEEFEKQFSELTKFSESINDYVVNLQIMIKGMKEIKIDK